MDHNRHLASWQMTLDERVSQIEKIVSVWMGGTLQEKAPGISKGPRVSDSPRDSQVEAALNHLGATVDRLESLYEALQRRAEPVANPIPIEAIPPIEDGLVPMAATIKSMAFRIGAINDALDGLINERIQI